MLLTSSFVRACITLSLGGGVAAAAPPAPTDEAIKARAEKLVAEMTPEEKAGQLTLCLYLPALGPLNAASEKTVNSGTAGSVFFVTDPAGVNRLQRLAMETSRLHPTLLFGFDVIHGFQARQR